MEVINRVDRQLEFRLWLQEEFSRRCRTNTSFSIRAFAKYLGVDSSALSQILSGKRRVSDKMMERFFTRLESRADFQNKNNKAEPYSIIQADVFAVIADWHHFAILDLTLLKGFKSDPCWIASKLDISLSQTQFAIERLKRLGMLAEKNGKLKKAKSLYSNYIEGASSSAHKEYQRQVIGKALTAIDHCPQEKKDITGITIAANSKKLAEAKEKIKAFRRELCAFMEDGEGDSVYHLTLQLYPVTNFNLE